MVSIVILIVFVIMLVVFLTLPALYTLITERTPKPLWFYHNIMHWHEPYHSIKHYEGINQVSICKHCGKKIIKDSQGNWFDI